MQNFQMRNIHPEFDALVEKSLGRYVYVLCDGETPFYVGKGGGNAGKGNARLLDHFEDARSKSRGGASRTRKIQKIHDIWEKGDVNWFILRKKIDNESSAFMIECAAIDLLTKCGFQLANDQGGHYGVECGMIATPADLFAMAAKPFTPNLSAVLRDRPIMLFNVRNEARSNGYDYDAATREAWIVGKKYRDITDQLPPERKPIALGIADNVARSVLVIDRWEKVETNAESKRQRWRIVTDQELDAAAKTELMHRNFRDVLKQAYGFWKQGGWIAFKVPHESEELSITRGVKPPGFSGDTA